jgi:hypothetical protein
VLSRHLRLTKLSQEWALLNFLSQVIFSFWNYLVVSFRQILEALKKATLLPSEALTAGGFYMITNK